ncbi:hypothetical protein Q604_UNBC03510G0001, partial [human gut metagenome]
LPQLHRLRLSQQEVKHRAGRRARVRAGGSVAHDELTRTQPRQTHHTHSLRNLPGDDCELRQEGLAQSEARHRQDDFVVVADVV